MLNGNTFLRKIISNVAWLFFEKILRLGVSIFVVALLARYLQPEQFGILNYSISLVSIFTVISALGLNGIVVRDLINKPNNTNVILGTAFILRISSAFAAYIILTISIFILRPDNEESRFYVTLLGLVLFFRPSEIIKWWFESQVKSKYSAWVESSTFLIIASLNVSLVYFGMPLISFIYALIAEAFLLSFLLLYTYSKVVGTLTNWRVSIEQAKDLLKESWPLIISSTAWIIYNRIDQIMIGELLDDQAVGYYSVASKLSETVIAFPTIIAFSIIPTIIKFRKSNIDYYQQKFQLIYDITIIPVIFIALVTTYYSDSIINLLFGDQYRLASSGVLVIHIWSIIFTAMAVVSGKYLINEGLQRITMQRHLIGLTINITLNYLMIPVYGIEGAAMATLISLALSNYVFDISRKETKVIFFQKTKSILFIFRLNTIANSLLAMKKDKK